MKILTEYKDKKEPNTLTAISTYGLSIKDFIPGEAVGIYLKQLYPDTILLIEQLLKSRNVEKLIKVGNKWKKKTTYYPSHPVTLKYNDVQYKLYSIDDWKSTHQDPKDQIKTRTERHPILQEYLDKRKEYSLKVEATKRQDRFKTLYNDYPELEFVTDEEMDLIIHNYAPLFQMPIDYEDSLEKMQTYIQLKFYIDNEFKPDVIPSDEEMIITFGNELYFEDLIYKQKSEEEVLRLSCVGNRVIK